MNYEFDPKKLANNVQKHQIWFHLADDFEWETAVIKIDSRNEYGEPRFTATGIIHNRLYILVFCLRETAIRIISLRRANTREIKRYANQN